MLCTASVDMYSKQPFISSRIPHISPPIQCKSTTTKIKHFFRRLFRMKSNKPSCPSHHSHSSGKTFSSLSHTWVNNSTGSWPRSSSFPSLPRRILSALSLASNFTEKQHSISHPSTLHHQETALSASTLNRRLAFLQQLSSQEEAYFKQESINPCLDTLDQVALHRRSCLIKERIQSATSSIMELTRDEFARVVEAAGFTIVNDDEFTPTPTRPIYECLDMFEPPSECIPTLKEIQDQGPGLLQSDTVTSTQQGRFTVTRYPSVKKSKKVFKLVDASMDSPSCRTLTDVDISSLLLSPSGVSVIGPMNRSSLYDVWNMVSKPSKSVSLSNTPPLSDPGSCPEDQASFVTTDLPTEMAPQELELVALASLSLGLEAHMMETPSPLSLLSVKKTKTGRMFTLERKPDATRSDSEPRKGRFTFE